MHSSCWSNANEREKVLVGWESSPCVHPLSADMIKPWRKERREAVLNCKFDEPDGNFPRINSSLIRKLHTVCVLLSFPCRSRALHRRKEPAYKGYKGRTLPWMGLESNARSRKQGRRQGQDKESIIIQDKKVCQFFLLDFLRLLLRLYSHPPKAYLSCIT